MTDRRKRLRRLDEVWVPSPTHFVTTCAASRIPRLATESFHAIAVEVWQNCERLYGWAVGRYVIMPDHVHFFIADARGETSLSDVVGKWKEWTAKYAAQRLSYTMPLWQRDFFDHVLRSSESEDQKWEYVRENPVRAGFVADSSSWRYQGQVCDIGSICDRR